MTTTSQILAKAPWKRQAMSAPIPERTPTLPAILEYDWEKDTLGVCTPNVKNTFITLELPKCAQARRKSVPASSRLCRGDHDSILAVNFLKAHLDSDASTDAHTEPSTCSPCGPLTPDYCLTPTTMDYYCVDEPASADAWGWPQAQNLWLVPPSSLAPSVCETPRLNSQAASFQPQALATQQQEEQTPENPSLLHKQPIADVIRQAKKRMQASENIASVEICGDMSGWSIIIQPSKEVDSDDWQTELVLTAAKEALLEAAANTKHIFVLGYCSQNATLMRAQGFDATLGVMQTPTQACWHVFKKGFCRHAGDCNKQHPVAEVPVRVLVESAQFNACAGFVSSFKQEVADVTMAVMATLAECAFAAKVEALKDAHSQGWTIEVMPNEASEPDKEYLVALAKNALFSATSNSDSVYIMGYSAKPFVPNAGGFVGVLGDMQYENRVCWDLYSKGVCSRGCECRLVHPECLVPIKVVVKERPPVVVEAVKDNEMEAVLDYLGEAPTARKGHWKVCA